MAHKICKNCGEFNSASAIYCCNCNSSLRDVKKREDAIDPIKFSGKAVGYNYSEEVTLGEWIIILILSAIPILNLIVLVLLAFVWNNTSINNFGKASLILVTIGILIYFLFG
ncbi:hypothetical protein [Vallitalea guaymasensis]|uniref:Zinc ribbon domain-containing protein n=1 Tax=Vallitalea guaymasensis TaxID=1185412 RepID=A0A8J8MDZ9_9FIRM|nr:hypothetical protein [Vallitalea guaymasensis]QUH31078.1 hypothetical protein HYG85_20000 [Vallitalea guaymasensis]